MLNFKEKQFFHALLTGGVGAQLVTESTGEDGFFDKVDLLQNPFDGFLGLLLFDEEVVQDADNFGLFVFFSNRDFKITITQCGSIYAFDSCSADV